jgi:hypothetical protein
MKRAKRIVVLATGMVLGAAQGAWAAQQPPEEDSAYRWGRWAVLSPAAGGTEPYVQVATPGADYNARPGDASQFDPVVLSTETPPPVADDPRDRLPPPPPPVTDDPRDRLPPPPQ